MKFSAQTDVAMSQEDLFQKLTDIDWLSQKGAERGITVTQTHGEGFAKGNTWRAEFQARRKTRALNITVENAVVPNELVMDAQGEFLAFHLQMTLSPIDEQSTKLSVDVEARGENLQGRLLVQSAKLARNRLSTLFAQRLDSFAGLLSS